MHQRSPAGRDQSRPGSHTGGIRLDGLGTGITRRSGDHGPPKVGCFCTKPLTFLIYLGGLKLPCIDSARRQKWGWPPHSQGGQVAGGDCRWHCQGRGGHSGRENPAFGEPQSEPAELNVGEGQWGSSCPSGALQMLLGSQPEELPAGREGTASLRPSIHSGENKSSRGFCYIPAPQVPWLLCSGNNSP